MTWYDIEIKIGCLECTAPEYYLNALMVHIKEMIERELNNAPEGIVKTFDKVEAMGKVKE